MAPTMNLSAYDTSLQALASAQSTEDITTVCRELARQLGFDHFVYALRVPVQFSDSRLVLVDGYPPSWVAHYFEQGHYRHDPVMAWCAHRIVPAVWSDLPLEAHTAPRRMMDEAADFGLKHGVTMPVHTPHGELGVLSFSMNRAGPGSDAAARQALPFVQLLAGHVHEALRRVSGLDEEGSRPQLTERERECLRWAADGKSSWEIGQLLKVSERTANFHLNNAMAKLDVCTRQHAVARAALQGLIQPSPF
jgi:DNA-binding CsgD family transcriptional regulator